MHSRVNIPPYYGRPVEVAEVWTLHKDEHVADCHLWTHPTGGEARVTINGEWHRGQAGRDGLALVDLALEWKAQFLQKGWRDD